MQCPLTRCSLTRSPMIKTNYWPTKIPYVVATDEVPNDKDISLYY